MKRNILLTGLFFLLILSSHAQNKPFLEMDTIIADMKFDIYAYQHLKVHDNELTNFRFSSDYQYLFIDDLFKGELTKTKLVYSKRQDVNLRFILDIEIYRNNLYILTAENIYHFFKIDSSYFFKKNIDLPIRRLRNYEKLKFTSGRLLAYINRYMYSPIQQNFNAKVLSCDSSLNDMVFTNIIENQMDEFMGITSNYSWVCAMKNGLIFSEIGKYKLYYYSALTHQISTLDTNTFSNSINDFSRIKLLQKRYYMDPTTSILSDSLTKFEEVYAFISEIMAINDSVFCVYYSKKGKSEKNYCIDFWKVSNNNIVFMNTLPEVDYCNPYSSNILITRSNFYPGWMHTRKYIIGSSLLLFSFWPYNYQPVGKSFKDLCDEYKKRKNKFSMFKYSIKM